MNIVKLQIVVLIEKYKKVTDVAAEMGLKQPTVSFHMKSLESELGTPLFQYRSGRVLLTDAGRTLYQYASRIVALTAEAERSIKQYASLSSGHLELEAGFVPGTYLLPKMVSQFIRRHPGLDISLSVQPEALIRERLRGREIQMAVMHTAEGQDSSLTTLTIARNEAVLVFAPGHPFADIKDFSPEQVVLEPWIQHEPASFLRGIAEEWAQLNGVRVWGHAMLSSPEAIKGMIREGGGAGLLSKAGIEAEVASGGLCYAPLPGVQPEHGEFVLAWRKDYALTPLQRAFAELAAPPKEEEAF
ncbi:LysR family transcriptional regulator [Paenibacillus sp. S150]|uniref:LysR family transcriptional regulator n=1 Tax=Paenibacillus sp. S150 TaxID=2749826 RepID=UPI001C57A596|nr:LysR family transcriptional regulator [Paenibacillus sp. S150]MBW4080532.1 LysR family transcriptional regulator [Paenibacillus sp. S150]